MYLETIYVLSQNSSHVRAIDVGEYMNFSKPSVSRAIGLLKKDGLVITDDLGGLKLTEAGENTGETIREWLDSMSYEEKQHFIAVLYDLVDEYKTVGQLFTAKNLYKVMQEYRGMDKDKKKIVADAVGIL